MRRRDTGTAVDTGTGTGAGRPAATPRPRSPRTRRPLPRPRALGALVALTACALAAAPASWSAAPARERAEPSGAAAYAALLPAPLAERAGSGAFTLTAGTGIDVPSGVPAVAGVGDYLAGLLRPATGYALPVVPGGQGHGIALRLDRPAGADAAPAGPGAADAGAAGPGAAPPEAAAPTAARAGAAPATARAGAAPTARGGAAPADDPSGEGYRLTVRPGEGVVIAAGTPAGLFHGVQTLRQLLPAAVGAGRRGAGPWSVPAGSVTDAPRYAYRGAMLDVARHFFGVRRVERYIDELALYKVNYLHLHLTDDQGWRIAIRSWPRLAEYGGTTQVGGGSGGFYTRADYERIVRYAASRFITVVPEIDMPAHTNAALASYGQLDCDGTAPALYTGIAVGFSSLCVGKEETYAFVRDVVDEVAAMTPGPYVHIGGDEAHSTSAADYRTFMDRVQPLVRAAGRTVMAWNQITGADVAPGTVGQYWGTTGREGPVLAAARAGTRFVLSPANHTYLDMKYDEHTALGLHWAGYVEVRDAYDWDPATYLHGAPASAVLGVEAPLWSETLTRDADIDPMAFPRLPAVAELGWSPAASHDWSAFARRLAAQAPRWQALGIDWYRSPQVPWDA